MDSIGIWDIYLWIHWKLLFSSSQINVSYWHKVTFQLLYPPLKASRFKIDGWFYITRWSNRALFERFDVSELRVAQAPQIIDFIAGFTRAAPCPWDQLKLFSASAIERSWRAFCKTFGFTPSWPAKAVQNCSTVLSLISVFWRSKRKKLAIGETLLKTGIVGQITNIGVLPLGWVSPTEMLLWI